MLDAWIMAIIVMWRPIFFESIAGVWTCERSLPFVSRGRGQERYLSILFFFGYAFFPLFSTTYNPISPRVSYFADPLSRPLPPGYWRKFSCWQRSGEMNRTEGGMKRLRRRRRYGKRAVDTGPSRYQEDSRPFSRHCDMIPYG
ncbi:hypothetical protein BJY00DRAFT_190327 [Aspergillus carlsbadensis]|nr:hypothetical protein BJY00DRAFT_190327 [Aspergillus carlsbadensis]